MKINGWTCTIGEGDVRTAKHPENGTAVFFKNSRFIGHADCPVEVMRWLLRPLLREVWRDGVNSTETYGYNVDKFDEQNNPFWGEPPNKDNDVS